jgi:hypothetical protein
VQLEALKADGRERTRGKKGELRPAVQQRAASNHDGGGYNEHALDPRIHIPANPNPNPNPNPNHISHLTSHISHAREDREEIDGDLLSVSRTQADDNALHITEPARASHRVRDR